MGKATVAAVACAPYTFLVNFRSRLLRTLEAIQGVLEEPGVLVVDWEVPNLLETNAASTLVVSQVVDIMVPVARRRRVAERLGEIRGLKPSTEEPSVWIPESTDRSR